MSYIGSTFSQQLTTPAVDYFNGNGITTSFQLTRTVTSVNAVQVFVNNVPQNAREAYGITSSNQLVFTSAPSAGTNNIYVVYDSQVGQFVTPSPGTVNTEQLGSISNINSINSDLVVRISGTEQLRVSSTRPLAVESSTLASPGSPSVTVRGESNTERIVIYSSGAGGGTPVFSAFASRGTELAPTASQSGDALGFYQFGSHDGTNFNRGAWIQGVATENHSLSSRGTAISFYTTPNGSTSIAEVMRIDPSGRVTQPAQPAFMVQNPASITGNGNTNVVTSWSGAYTYCFTGSNFNTSLGRFTAPVAGRYFFSAQLMPSGDANVKFVVPFVNGVRAPTLVLPYLQGGSTRATIGFSIILNLSAGDFVEVGANAASGSSFDNSGYFCGYLLG